MATTLAQELVRLEQAKRAIASAIRTKNVEVLESAKIDSYAELISSIEQGCDLTVITKETLPNHVNTETETLTVPDTHMITNMSVTVDDLAPGVLAALAEI
jgi:hypothetical protein